MDIIIDAWSVLRSNIFSIMKNFNVIDAIDILAIAYLFYQAMRLVRETRAMQIVKGIVAIVALYFISDLLSMSTLRFFLSNILTSGVIVIAVVFQPEFRRALEQLGRTKFSALGKSSSESSESKSERTRNLIDSICGSVESLSPSKTGALIVIEREIKLGEIIKTGTFIDARPSSELISNLFFHNSPLHDGAVVARDGRICAAGCFLPLSSNMEIGRELGTRHRAALGMSELSDALIVVVSEETGAVTLAIESKLHRELSLDSLLELLEFNLLNISDDNSSDTNTPFWRKKIK